MVGFQCGTPSPDKAGIKSTPFEFQSLFMSASVSLASVKKPRPSRNHLTIVPHEKILPSSAYAVVLETP